MDMPIVSGRASNEIPDEIVTAPKISGGSQGIEPPISRMNGDTIPPILPAMEPRPTALVLELLFRRKSEADEPHNSWKELRSINPNNGESAGDAQLAREHKPSVNFGHPRGGNELCKQHSDYHRASGKYQRPGKEGFSTYSSFLNILSI